MKHIWSLNATGAQPTLSYTPASEQCYTSKGGRLTKPRDFYKIELRLQQCEHSFLNRFTRRVLSC